MREDAIAIAQKTAAMAAAPAAPRQLLRIVFALCIYSRFLHLPRPLTLP
jgi:hypothetical protein